MFTEEQGIAVYRGYFLSQGKPRGSPRPARAVHMANHAGGHEVFEGGTFHWPLWNVHVIQKPGTFL